MPTTIELTRGYHAIVDDADAEMVKAIRWAAYKCHAPSKSGKEYVYAYSWKHGCMHRVIMGLGKIRDCAVKMDVDHINGNCLDNRRENLRVVSRAANIANQKPRSASGYKGVCFESKKEKPGQTKRWRARLKMDGRMVYLGNFLTREEAGHAVDIASKARYGPHAVLNLPEAISA